MSRSHRGRVGISSDCARPPMTTTGQTGSTAQERGESPDAIPTHQCPTCEHKWQYTGTAERPTCPSCGMKVPEAARVGEPTEYTLVALEGGSDGVPRFDVDVSIDTAERAGRVNVIIDLTKEECEAMWERLKEDGHVYPGDEREKVLEALNLGHVVD